MFFPQVMHMIIGTWLAVASNRSSKGSELSPSFSPISFEKEIFCLQTIRTNPEFRKREPFRWEINSRGINCIRKRRNYLGNLNLWKNRSKRNVELFFFKWRNTLGGDSFNKDNDDDFFALCKRYFYAKKVSNVVGFSATTVRDGCIKIEIVIILLIQIMCNMVSLLVLAK